MDKRSLKIIREKILETIEKTDIESKDKIELYINLYHFLDEENYKDNIDILKRKGKIRRK